MATFSAGVVLTELRRAKSYLSLGLKPFYRRYPYRGRLQLSIADARGMIDLERSLFYSRVPKAANSTVVAALTPGAGSSNRELIAIKQSYAKPSSLNAEEVACLDDCVKFTVVRDPYTRALSCYLDKIVSGPKLGYLAEHGGFAGKPTFEQFCEYLATGGLYSNAHWAPQTSLLLMPLSAFDYVGRVESLNKDVTEIFRLLQLEPPVTLERAGPRATHAEKALSQYMTKRAKHLIADLYKLDFAAFGYAV